MVIGVTGSIGAGKSTFSKFLYESIKKRLNNKFVLLLNADALAKELIQKSLNEDSSTDSLAGKLKRRFGSDIQNQDGTLNKTLLAERAFASEKSEDDINKIVHPYVLSEIERLAEDSDIAVIDVPLLFESGMNSICSKVITVIADEKIRKERSVRLKDFDARDSFQMPPEKKSMMSDCVVDNNGSLYELQERAEEIAKKILI